MKEKGKSMIHLQLALACAAIAVLGSGRVRAADNAVPEQPTFHRDVLPILQENCQVCHRPAGDVVGGMVAPMSFMSYAEVRPWAKSIAQVVDARVMPPWDASPDQHGIFANERTLTDTEIETIQNWVKTGARQGNPADAPTPVEWKAGWVMGEPDLIIAFPEPFFVADEIEDLYHNVTIKLTEEMLPEDKWISRLEFVPGSEAVHHIIAYATRGEYEASDVEEDANLEGEEEFLRGRVMLGGLAPGTDPSVFPEGYGIPLAKGVELTFAMHYHKESGPGTGVWDKSMMALKFTDGKPERELKITNIAHGAFEIPPNHPNWKVSGARTFEKDIILISLMPHTHLRGVEARYIAFHPRQHIVVSLQGRLLDRQGLPQGFFPRQRLGRA